MRRGLSIPNSAWAALPGITGSKREDPLRRQCSEHLTVRSSYRTGRCPGRLREKVTNSARRNRTRSVSRRLPVDVPRDEQDERHYLEGTHDVKGFISYDNSSSITVSYGERGAHIGMWRSADFENKDSQFVSVTIEREHEEMRVEPRRLPRKLRPRHVLRTFQARSSPQNVLPYRKIAARRICRFPQR